jgi:predicted  nucleic acid-binding Zn-ribbon protein
VQSNKDIRESLTAEVAEKHDEILSLRHTVRDLQDKCRETEMKVLLKDDVIKELRKDLKDLKAGGFKVITLR